MQNQSNAGVAQLAERELPKLEVMGSTPTARCFEKFFWRTSASLPKKAHPRVCQYATVALFCHSFLCIQNNWGQPQREWILMKDAA